MIAPARPAHRRLALTVAAAFTLSLLAGLLSGQRAAPLRAALGECEQARPEWLMCEDFEDGHLGWQAWLAGSPFTECNGCRADGSNDPGRILLTDAPGAAASGDWALHMPAAEAAGYQGASLTYRSCAGEKRPGCRLTGYEKLHFRTRVRLAEDHQYVHHFLSIAGTRPDRYWDSDGNAGCRPNGYRAAGTTLDFDAGRELFFYTYYPEMRCDSGGYCSGDYARQICEGCARKEMPCTERQECCWGNHFGPEPPVVLPRGQWVCLELMLELNTPGQADGRMVFWVDGIQAHEVTGMHWRDVAELQLNKAWLQHYIAGGDADRPNRVWFDDMVVSTDYIGCSGPAEAPTETATPTVTATRTEPRPEPTASATAIPTAERWWGFLPRLLRGH